MATVKMVRLISNEEIICKVTENDDNTITIKNPAAIMPVGEGQLAMVPWLPHAVENGITISMDRVMFMFEPLTELANEYSTKFGSGLVVPTGPVPTGAPLKISGSVDG